MIHGPSIKFGYTTGKSSNTKDIPPYKRRKVTLEKTSIIVTARTTSTSESETESETQSEIEYEESETSEEQSSRKRKNYSKAKLRTSKVANICRQLSREGIDADTDSQSGIYRTIKKEL